MSLQSPLERLQQEPSRFSFDAAVRLLLGITPEPAQDETLHGNRLHDNKIRFAAAQTLAQPGVEVVAAEAGSRRQRARLVTTVFGLTGASSVLPRWYTELLAQAARLKNNALIDFFDLLAQRFAVAFARAGIKYRLHRSAETVGLSGGQREPISAALLALTGYATGHLEARLPAGAEALCHYAGYLAARPRSSERLTCMAGDYIGRKVAITEFSGAWLVLTPDQQSRMPAGVAAGAFHQLGVDCAIGRRAWDQQACFILHIGPLRRQEFEDLLPDRKRLQELTSLVRAYVGWEADFAINLRLDVAEIPPLRLAGRQDEDAPRLGWTSWLPSETRHLRGQLSADEAMFSAALIEGLN